MADTPLDETSEVIIRAGSTSDNELEVTVTGAAKVDGSAVTQPISAVSLPLPTGATTETTLSSIDTKTPTIGQKTMVNSSPIVVASDQSEFPVKQGSPNASISNGWPVKLTDGLDNLAINSDGSINTAIINPPAPVDATPVNISAFGDVASTAGVDTYYTITNAKTLTIQTLLAGAEYEVSGSIVELFYDPNGDLTVLTRISTIFVNATSDTAPVQQIFIGNGTRRIVLRRRGFGASAREMFAQWFGYEE